MKKHVIEVPLYRGNLIILEGADLKELQTECEGFDPSGDFIFAHAVYCAYEGKDGFFVIFNAKNSHAKLNLGCVAHEAAHVASFICNERGILADHNNDEAFAYLVEWVAIQIVEFFKRENMLDLLL